MAGERGNKISVILLVRGENGETESRWDIFVKGKDDGGYSSISFCFLFEEGRESGAGALVYISSYHS